MARHAKPRDLPPPLELECLKALWTIGEGNVRDIRTVMLQDRALAYTTVMTVLDRLVRRGGVARRKAGRSFIYSPVLSRESLRSLALRQFLDSYFDGSEQSLRAYLEIRDSGVARVQPVADPSALDSRLDASLL